MSRPKKTLTNPSIGVINPKSPTSRDRIPARNAPYWFYLAKGLHLGYRKGARESAWVVRLENPRRQTIVGKPDDPGNQGSAECPILTYDEAVDLARKKGPALISEVPKAPPKPAASTVPDLPRTPVPPGKTVGDALDLYLSVLAARSLGDLSSARNRIQRTRRELGHIPLKELTSQHLWDWMEMRLQAPRLLRPSKVVPIRPDPKFNPDDEECRRRRQVTINRSLADLKAALNMVYTSNAQWLDTDQAWRSVASFDAVEGARQEVLSRAQQAAFLNACLPEFRPLAYVALLTGQRYGVLGRLKVGDYRPLDKVLYIGKDKAGGNRFAPLTDEALAVLWAICEGRDASEPLLLRAGGGAWGRNHQKYAMDLIQETLQSGITFYGLRHTCITMWLLNGIDAAVVAEAVGTSLAMIQKHYKHLDPMDVGNKINEKAPKVGAFTKETESILAKINAMRAERVMETVDLAFTLESLHPSTYLGKRKGGLEDAGPLPPRPTKDELVSLVQQMPLTEIALKYNVSDQSVAKWCRRWGIERPGRGYWARQAEETAKAKTLSYRVTPAELAELIQTMPIFEIGKKFGVSDQTVTNWCRKWGISTPGRGHGMRKRPASLDGVRSRTGPDLGGR